MRTRIYTAIIIIGAAICFIDVAYAQRDRDPGPWLTAALGVLLIRSAITAKGHPVVVTLSASLLTAIAVLGNRGSLNINNPVWMGAILLGFAGCIFGEKTQRLWQ